MQYIIYALIIAALAYTNRHWRGDGSQPKWEWLALNFILAWCVSYDFIFASLWLLFAIGYACPAWHAMFSAMHGQEPQRDDKPYIQWMQVLSRKLGRKYSKAKGVELWKHIGIIYGALRSLFVLPVIALLVWYKGSIWPLSGLAMIGMGYVYYLAGKADKAEYIMGAILGVIMIVSFGM